jgi:hypothetical protein
MLADTYRSGLTHLKTRVTIAYIILGVSYAVVALTILLSCQPFHHFWQVSPDPGLLCQPTKSPAYVLVVVIPNILTDVYLLSIPLPVSHLFDVMMLRSDPCSFFGASTLVCDADSRSCCSLAVLSSS